MTSYLDIDSFAAGNPAYGTFNPGPTSGSYGHGFNNLSAGIPGCGEAQAMPVVVSYQMSWSNLITPGTNAKSLVAGDVVTASCHGGTITFICAGHVPVAAEVHVPIVASGTIEVSTTRMVKAKPTPEFYHINLGLKEHLLLGRLLTDINDDRVLVYATGPVRATGELVLLGEHGGVEGEDEEDGEDKEY